MDRQSTRASNCGKSRRFRASHQPGLLVDLDYRLNRKIAHSDAASVPFCVLILLHEDGPRRRRAGAAGVPGWRATPIAVLAQVQHPRRQASQS